MPNRIVRDGMLSSEKVCALDWGAEVFYRRLMHIADDYGRHEANAQLLRSKCYPLQVDAVSGQQVRAWLDQCAAVGLVRVYAVDGKEFLEITKFGQQQRSASKCPDPPAVDSKCYQLIANEHLDVVVVGGVVDKELPNGNSSPSASADEPAPKSEPIPYQAIVDAYNGTMTRLAKARGLTPKRRTLIRSAWQASPERRSIEFWQALFEEYEADDFTNGTGPYSNGHEGWRPTLDYLLRQDVVTRTFERAMDRLERCSEAT